MPDNEEPTKQDYIDCAYELIDNGHLAGASVLFELADEPELAEQTLQESININMP